MFSELPLCPKCKSNKLVPLSDYSQDGASVIFKAWACPADTCKYALRIDKGVVTWSNKESGR